MKLDFRRFIILTAALSVLSVSCEKGQKRANTIIEDNLFGIEYDDYDFEAGVEYYSRHLPPKDAPACSEVRKGDYIGRNLDYYINRNASAIIKVNANGKRLASVGVVGCSREFSRELAADGRYDSIYEYLPLRTSDGINEKGVYIGVNVVPTGETSLDSEKWRYHEWGLGAAFTNKSSDKEYPTLCLTRFVLDNAVSVDDAIQKIMSVNWYDPYNYPFEGDAQSFHWMLADGTKNCVVEFLENELVVTVADDIDKASFGTVMTNFTNACMAAEVMQYHGQGYERFDILSRNYDAAEESFAGMEALMQKVWYSKYYTTPERSEDYWLSETELEGYAAWELYHHYELWDNKDLQDQVASDKAAWADKNNWYNDSTSLWFTVHNSVYNLKEKKFEVLVHEGMGAQKSYLNFDLNSSFHKPLKN